MPLFGPPDVKKLEAKKDIKGLIRALEYERDKENERRKLSGSSYARGATKDVERIQRNMKRASDIRESAAQALGKLSNPDAVMPLIDALDDNDRVYQVAADALAQLKDSRAIAPLVRQITKGRDSAIKITKEIDSELAVEPLIRALQDENEPARRQAAKALRQLGDARAVEPLIQALQDKNGDVRLAAAGALMQLGDARAVDPLIQTLEDNDSNVRQQAASALGQLGDSRAVDPLIQTLRDEDWRVRETTIEALGQLGDGQAVEPLIQALEDKEYTVRKGAVRALAELKSVDSVVTVLNNGSWGMKAEAAESLERVGWVPKTEREKALVAVINKDWEKVAGLAESSASALGELFDNVSGKLFEGQVEKVIEILGQLSDRRTFAPLVRIAGNEKLFSEMRLKAAETLLKSGWSPQADPESGTMPGATTAVEIIVEDIMGRLHGARYEATHQDGKIREYEAHGVSLQNEITRITKLLETHITLFNLGTLHRMASMESQLEIYLWRPSCQGPDVTTTFDCSQIKQLARQELIRRGEQA
ncbi:HEAT repeat domain-containing protein [Aggregatilinea lenta]|uniref:HEAT repeat domain-containing protein n=1 Tax=Aggregatilinea lenta TaxID=913108 RepID=UPI000E5C4A6A|nr:HEAT repeat domain-containing protein [Aggregatilinea lenta]